MRLAIGNHAEEAAAGVIVLAMFAEMAGELVDPLRKESDLDLGRTAVLVMNGGDADNLGLLSRC